ncbi:MAG: TolC family protein [Planctomycetota bacterium]
MIATNCFARVLGLPIAAALALTAAGCSTSSRRLPRLRPEPAWLTYAGPGAPASGPRAGEDDSTRALAGDVELAGLLEAAARRNPRIAAAKSRWLAARTRPVQARSLPDPLLTYTEFLSPVETRVGPMDRSFMLRQNIPFPGRLDAAGRMAERQADVQRFEYEILLRDTVAEVKVSFAELLYLHRAIEIVEQNQQIARQLAEKASALYARDGEVAPDAVSLFDTLKAQSQLAQLGYDLITLVELRKTEEAKLNALLSRSPDASLGRPVPLAYRPLQVSRERLFEIALDRRQELKAALQKIAVAEEARRIAELSQVPDFSVGLQHTVIGSASSPVAGSGDDALALTLGFSLPVWLEKNRARIHEAEQLRRAATEDRRAQIDDLMGRITQVDFQLESARRLVELYGTSLIPQAEEAMRIAEDWRDTGRDTFGRLLEAQSVWLNFQLAYQRSLADYEQIVARLEQLVGTSLGIYRGEVSE